MDGYLWLKALHLISVIAWMAGLLYLPRLFVYHVTVPPGSSASETFKVMERKLYRYIMTPAMIASWLFGLWMIAELGTAIGTMGWLHAKLLLVVAMSAFHGLLGSWRRAFAEDRNRRSQRFFRITNEIPTLLMIAIVILAIVKPF
jgi:putative membrane protein